MQGVPVGILRVGDGEMGVAVQRARRLVVVSWRWKDRVGAKEILGPGQS